MVEVKEERMGRKRKEVGEEGWLFMLAAIWTWLFPPPPLPRGSQAVCSIAGPQVGGPWPMNSSPANSVGSDSEALEGEVFNGKVNNHTRREFGES
jgi:hypothetical protein